MDDLTLPMKGGWIMCKQVPPTVVKPMMLGVYYARPEKVFERGSFERGYWGCAWTESELRVLYKHRQNAKLNGPERETIERMANSNGKRRKRAVLTEAPLWSETEDDYAPEPVSDGPVLEDLVLEMRVRILTPDGEVCLEPYEYSIVKDIEPYVECIGEGYIMRELGGLEKAKKLKEQLFYVMSRGITKLEGYKLLLGQIERPNVFWLEPSPEIRRVFDRSFA